MKNSSEPVSPRMINRAAMKSWDRSRNMVIELLRKPSNTRTGRGTCGREFVTRAVHGHQISRRGGVRLQLLAQSENVIVHGARGRIVLIAPDLVEKLFARDDAARRRGQVLQQFELLRCQCYRLSASCRFHTGEVN